MKTSHPRYSSRYMLWHGVSFVTEMTFLRYVDEQDKVHQCLIAIMRYYWRIQWLSTFCTDAIHTNHANANINSLWQCNTSTTENAECLLTISHKTFGLLFTKMTIFLNFEFLGTNKFLKLSYAVYCGIWVCVLVLNLWIFHV